MKFRNGFVSNSSSSSFIISKDEYPTIWDLALHMLEIRDLDNVEKFGENESPLISNEQKRTIARKISKCNLPSAVTFPSCNFDTFIVDVGSTYWVSTCNNHPFYRHLRGQLSEQDVQKEERELVPPDYKYDLCTYIEVYLEHYYDFESL
jgi:hypothetical protein